MPIFCTTCFSSTNGLTEGKGSSFPCYAHTLWMCFPRERVRRFPDLAEGQGHTNPDILQGTHRGRNQWGWASPFSDDLFPKLPGVVCPPYIFSSKTFWDHEWEALASLAVAPRNRRAHPMPWPTREARASDDVGGKNRVARAGAPSVPGSSNTQTRTELTLGKS